MKLYYEIKGEELNFIIVDSEEKENNLIKNNSVTLLEEDLNGINEAIKVASQYAKYYGVFYPNYIKKIIH